MENKAYILVEVSDNKASYALVENLMVEVGGKVVDLIIAEPDVIEQLGTPIITWEEAI
jgi:hypothetical protein